MEALITVSLSWQQGSLQSIWVLDLWTADGHWTAAIHQTVLPSALSINVTEHHYILPNIYKVKFVSSLIFASLSSGFHVLLFLPPSQKVLLIPDPQLTTLLQSLGFAVLKSRISTLLPSSMVLSQLRNKWHGPPACCPSPLCRFPLVPWVSYKVWNFEVSCRSFWAPAQTPAPIPWWQSMCPESKNIWLQSHEWVEESGSTPVHTCGGRAAVETHTIH